MAIPTAPSFQKDVAQQFLEAILGGVPAEKFGLLWRLPPRVSLWTRDASAATRWAATACRERANVYCGVALCDKDRGTDKRTSNDSATGLVGFVSDVDFANKAGAKKQYPKDADAASGIILGTGLTPTIMVHSGNGLQAWWLFNEPWLFDSDDERLTAIALSTAWGATIKEVARRAGCEVDSVHDLARVLRIPGSLNWKDPDNPKPVTIVWHDEAKRYTPADFEPKLLVKPEEPETVKQRTSSGGGGSAAVSVSPDAFPWQSHEALLANSEQYAATWNRTRGDLKDPSPSGWDMALANMCIQSGMTDDEATAVLVASRRRYADPIKPASYYRLTLSKAHSNDIQIDDDNLTREQRVDQIGHALNIPLTNIQRVTGSEPIYRFTLKTASGEGEERAVEIAATQLIQQGSFRGKIFALTDVPPRRIGPKEHPGWDDYVALIAQAAEEIDAGDDATVTGELFGLIEDFLGANRPVVIEDGALVEHPNHPFIRGGKVWFKANVLLRYASLNLNLKMTKQVLTQRLVVVGADRATIAVKKGKGKTTGSYYGIRLSRLEVDVEGTPAEEATPSGE